MPAPLVLGADLNEPPGGPSWATLGRRLRDTCAADAPTATYPARVPRARIDAVPVGEGVEVLEYGVPAQPPGTPAYAVATDHLPVLARLR